MQIHIKHFLVLIFGLIVIDAAGQKKWTLNECINYALENNLQIKQQELVIKQNENNLLQSKLDYIPNISGSVGHNFNWGRSVNMQELVIIKNKLSQSTSASIGASVTVLNGLNKYNTLRSNKIELKISETDNEKLRNDISINITKSYLQLLLAKQIYENAKLGYQSILKQKEKTQKLVDAGSQPYSSVLEITAQAASENVQVINAEGNVKTATLMLKQLLDIRDSEEFDIETPHNEDDIAFFYENSCEKIYSEALNLPQIRSANYSLENSKIRLSMAKGALFPSISVSGGYGTYYSDAAEGAFKQQFSDNRNPSVGISMSIPIFGGYRVSTGVKNAKIAVKNSELQLKMKQMELYKEIQSAITEARNYYERSVASKQTMKSMEESFRMTEKKFENGAVTTTDYIVSRTNMLKAQSEYYQSKFQYIFQLKILDYYKNLDRKL